MDFFAFDLGGTNVKWAIVNSEYHIIRKGSFVTPYGNSEKLVSQMTDIVKGQGRLFRAIGISSPGTFYESDEGTVYGGGNLTFLDQVPIGKKISEECEIPCYMENDGICCALGEYADGALKNTRCGVVLVLGTGVAGGTVINGQIYKGAHSFAGEFSFIRMRAGDDAPRFGQSAGWKKGLLEEIKKEKKLQEDMNVDGQMIFEWINEGDEGSKKALERYADNIAYQIWNLQAILDPDLFAIGGGISSQPVLIQEIQNAVSRLMEQNNQKRFPSPVIVPCIHGNDANLMGAVYNCVAKLKRKEGDFRK